MLESKMNELLRFYNDFSAYLNTRIVGCVEIVQRLFISLMIGGNILLEGPPGVGKTSMVKAFAELLDLAYSRIQFTPDLMPLDIIGSNILQQSKAGERSFEFFKGPIFANIVLGDEINRATPKTQSAFLEAMEEKRITFLGREYTLPSPFMVIATQNPIELEGTYPLPEAQIDRFLMKLYFRYPDFLQLKQIVNTNEFPDRIVRPGKKSSVETWQNLRALEDEVIVIDDIKNYISRLVVSTHPVHSNIPAVKQYVLYGASPRAGIYLLRASKGKALLESRINVSFEDIEALAYDVLNHRIILNFDAEAQNLDIAKLLQTVVQDLDRRYKPRA